MHKGELSQIIKNKQLDSLLWVVFATKIEQYFGNLTQNLIYFISKFLVFVFDVAKCCDILNFLIYIRNLFLRFSVDMSKFPVISRVHSNLEKLPEFQAAHPSQQPDAQ